MSMIGVSLTGSVWDICEGGIGVSVVGEYVTSKSDG